MTRMSVLETLVKARALIEKEEDWWPGPPYTSVGKNCAVTAIITICRVRSLNDYHYEGVGTLLRSLAASLPDDCRGKSLAAFNDTYGYAAVLKLYDRAIATEQRKLNIIDDKIAKQVQGIIDTALTTSPVVETVT